MRLSRRALARDNAVLQAQHLADSAVIGKLLAQVQESPALADNVRLAHHLEVAEMELHQLRSIVNYQDVRLARFVADNPDLFKEAG